MEPYEILNHDELDRLKDDLKGWTDYIPLSLLTFKDEGYWQNCTKDAKRKNRRKRQGLTGDDYLIEDILEWVKEYSQFEYIINWEKIE